MDTSTVTSACDGSDGSPGFRISWCDPPPAPRVNYWSTCSGSWMRSCLLCGRRFVTRVRRDAVSPPACTCAGEHAVMRGPMPSEGIRNRAWRLKAVVAAQASSEVSREKLIESVLNDFAPPLSVIEAESLFELIDCAALAPVRDHLLGLVERAPGWPLWHLLEYPTTQGVIDLRMRLVAKGHRPMESG